MSSTGGQRGALQSFRNGFRRYDGALKRRWPRGRWVAHGLTALVAVSLVASAAKAPASSSTVNPSAAPTTPVVAVLPSLATTASPSDSSEPAPSPEPTDSPPPTGTPTPTEEPTPEPTLEPPARPTATPSIVKTSGRGDKIVKFTAQEEPTVARITNQGSSNFAVVSYVGSSYDDLLVNEIGSYSGWVYVAAGVNRLKMTSSGSWTVEVRPIETARAWDGVSRLTGKGDTVVLLSGAASGITTIKNSSHSNFAVIAYSTEGDYLDLLVNEIGSYSGEVLLPDGDPMVLRIQDVGGTWSMSAVSF
jgi:hypothetical protein